MQIVVEALGTIRNARSDLQMLGINHGRPTDMIQISALLGSAHIIGEKRAPKQLNTLSKNSYFST